MPWQNYSDVTTVLIVLIEWADQLVQEYQSAGCHHLPQASGYLQALFYEWGARWSFAFPNKGINIYYIICIICNSAGRQSPLALCHIIQPYMLGETLLEWQLGMTCRKSYTSPDCATVLCTLECNPGLCSETNPLANGTTCIINRKLLIKWCLNNLGQEVIQRSLSIII
jgi:hypothetical protein